MKKKMKNKVLLILSFILPFMLILSNANFKSFGFSDAGEFSLVTKFLGIAHPPGFPSYVVIAAMFSKVLELFSFSHIASLVVFSAVCVSFASLFLFLTSNLLLEKLSPELNLENRNFISFSTAILSVIGACTWHWAHSIEVYGFQLFCMGMLIYGIVKYQYDRKINSLLFAIIGFALGLANHHLSMILFTPFLLFLFPEGWLTLTIVDNKKKVKHQKDNFFAYFFQKHFIIFSCLTLLILILFYGWMMIRSTTSLPFAFGNPDTLDRLFYHISGGAWIKNTQAEVKGIIGMRLPYFMRLTLNQFLLFIPFLIFGILYLLNKKVTRLVIAVIGYYLVVLFYQLRIDQAADTDAYMLSPFLVLMLLIPFGIASFIKQNQKLIYIVPLLLIFQVVINFPKTDLRKFNVSESLMRDFDLSSPKGSIILVADWTSIITYNYYRNEYHFRDDLIVLNYDLKFTNFKLLERNYPELYTAIKPEYDRFILLLGDAHPEEIYNTGCTLDNQELMNSYLAVIKKLQDYCVTKNVAFMADPKAYILLSQNGMFNVTHVSGSLVADRITGMGKTFPLLNYDWLNEPRLMAEPGASDKMVDLEAAMDFNRNYYRQTGNILLADQAEASYQRIKKIQRDMKLRMPFLFRPQ